MALAKAKAWIEEKRDMVGHKGPKCDSNKECLERQKVPCGFYSEDSESEIKDWIKKEFPKVLEHCGLSGVSEELNSCTICTDQVAHKSIGAFWVHVIHYHHKDVRAPLGDFQKNMTGRDVKESREVILAKFSEAQQKELCLPSESCPDKNNFKRKKCNYC